MNAVKKAEGGFTPSMRAQAEVARELVRLVGGKVDTDFCITLFYRTHQTAKLFKCEGVDTVEEEEIVAKATGKAMAAFKPTDEVEGMFAAQAVMLHNLSMEAGRRAMLPEQPSEIASKLRKDAANTARAFSDTVDALARYRGKGPQVVRVERVVVNEGGQAVVGVVSPATPSVTSGVAQQAIGQGSPPLATGDALPVVVGDVRGEGE